MPNTAHRSVCHPQSGLFKMTNHFGKLGKKKKMVEKLRSYEVHDGKGFVALAVFSTTFKLMFLLHAY